MHYNVLVNNIQYHITVNSYVLSITASSIVNDNAWKRTIYNYTPMYDIGIDSRSLIKLCKNSNIQKIIVIPDNNNINGSLFIIIDEKYTIIL